MQPTQYFGTPFFVSVPQNSTYRELYHHIELQLSRWIQPKQQTEEVTLENKNGKDSSSIIIYK